MSYALSSDLLITAPDLTYDSTVKALELGTKAVTPDGRGFRFCLAGGTGLVPGKLQQAPAEITNHQNLTPSAAAIGVSEVTVTLGATAATLDQYAGGYLVVTTTPGQGYQYKIKGHPAADSAATLLLTLEDSIRVALTASSVVDLVLNPYSGVILNPTTLTSCPVGVAVTGVTLAQYGWIQTGGVATLLADGANAVGANVVASNGIDGAVEDAASPGLQPLVGTCVTGAADTEYGAVLLNIQGA